tara:strand:- start:1604 stop:2968 length:1365 start_codon:yes stop_codon:yes gene_type:complete
MTMGFGEFAPAGLSWDRIFHKYNVHYSEKYGAESELDTVEDYEKDFIGFLETLVSVEDNERSLKADIWNNWAGERGFLVSGGYYETPDDSQHDEEEEIDEVSLEERGLNSIRRLIEDWSNNAAWMSEESIDDIEFQYKVEQIEKHHGDSLREAADWIMMSALHLGKLPPALDLEEIKKSISPPYVGQVAVVGETLYLMLRRWLVANGNQHGWKQAGSLSQVIFGGFGRIEDFPKTIHIFTGTRVSGLGETANLVFCRNVVDPNYPQPIYDSETIEWRSATFLEPLAQNEFIMRMTTGLADVFGVSPDRKIKSFTEGAIHSWLHHRGLEVLGQADGVSEELVKSAISHLEENMPGEVSTYIDNWIMGLQVGVKNDFRQAVHRLGSVELAEFASDLIAVQAKMHNIVYSQASVDLPVDVCYLSKENGFVWYSRKNMPDLQLNPRISSMNWPGSQLD